MRFLISPGDFRFHDAQSRDQKLLANFHGYLEIATLIWDQRVNETATQRPP